MSCPLHTEEYGRSTHKLHPRLLHRCTCDEDEDEDEEHFMSWWTPWLALGLASVAAGPTAQTVGRKKNENTRGKSGPAMNTSTSVVREGNAAAIDRRDNTAAINGRDNTAIADNTAMWSYDNDNNEVPTMKMRVNLPGGSLERDVMPQFNTKKGYGATEFAEYLQTSNVDISYEEKTDAVLHSDQLNGKKLKLLQKQVNFNRRAYDMLEDTRNHVNTTTVRLDYWDGNEKKPLHEQKKDEQKEMETITDAMVIIRVGDEEWLINGNTRWASFAFYKALHPGVETIYVGGSIVYIDIKANAEENPEDAVKRIAIDEYRKWMFKIFKESRIEGNIAEEKIVEQFNKWMKKEIFKEMKGNLLAVDI